MTSHLYQLAQVVAVVGWVLMAVEYISTLLMLPWTFRFGIPVWRRELSTATSEVPADTENAVVKIVTPSEWVFRHKFSLFGFQSPLPIRGTVRRGAQGITVTGRQPLGGALFLFGWAVFMGLPFGLLLAGGFYLLASLIERARFERAWDELSPLAKS